MAKNGLNIARSTLEGEITWKMNETFLVRMKKTKTLKFSFRDEFFQDFWQKKIYCKRQIS